MAKKKSTNNNLQNITHKTKDQVTRTPLKTNNNLQNITHKTKDQVTRTPLKTGGEHFFLLDHSNTAAKKKKHEQVWRSNFNFIAPTQALLQSSYSKIVQSENCIHWTLCSDWTFLLY
jgi:hypothetical protein